MSIVEGLLLGLKVSIGLLVLAIGLNARVTHILTLFRQPGLLLRSLLAMYVLVPLVAVMLVWLPGISPGSQLALIVLAISAGAPLLPRKLQFLNRDRWIFSLMVITSLFAIAIVPLWIFIIGLLLGVHSTLAISEVSSMLGKIFFLPMIIGMLFHWQRPAFSERFARLILRWVSPGLVACVLLLLALQWRLLLEAGWPLLLALALLSLAALFIGHVMGGPHLDGRVTLALACVKRQAGVAILVSAAVPGPRTEVFVAAYLVTSSLISLPYLKIQKYRRKALLDAEV